MSGRVDARAGFGAASAAMLLGALLLALFASGQPAPLTSADLAPPQADVAFVPNRGQLDGAVRYSARGPGFASHFTDRKLVLDLNQGGHGVALHLGFRGASPAPVIVAERRKPGRVNHLLGAERHTNLPTYAQLRYQDLWPGIDMVFRGSGGMLKYEFLVSPGADPADIRLAYAGADSLRVTADGSLAIGTPLGVLRDAPPRAFQGAEQVGSRYVVSGSSYGFALGRYDRSRSLTLDPGLAWSTFLGGADGEVAVANDVDYYGNSYVTGYTSSSDFPTTPGAYDTTDQAASEVFVSKFSPGGVLFFSTYLGGDRFSDESLGTDRPLDIAVDGSGSAYVLGGVTDSLDFPTTPGAYRTAISEGQELSFVTKFTPEGDGLVYSTFIAGEMLRGGIDVDPGGGAYITGETAASNYPTTPGAYDETFNGPGFNAVLTKLNASGSALDYSTFLGPGFGVGIAVDGSGHAYVTGDSAGSFPTTPGAYDESANGGRDVFVTKVNPSGSALLYSTFVGGPRDDVGADIVVDRLGGAYVTGQPGFEGFPTTPGAYSTDQIGGVFATKLDPSGSALEYSTFLGGTFGRGIAVDGDLNAYVAGTDSSASVPTTPDAYDPSFNGGGNDAFLSVLNASGSALRYSTYLGSSGVDIVRDVGVDGAQSAYLVGEVRASDLPTPGTTSDFPTTADAYDATFNGIADAFVTKLNTSAFTGYPRPKSASPARFSLVVAYEQCSDPDLTHGPPLAHPSCGAPQKTSDHLTVGTPDANGLGPWNDGFLKLKTLVGDPATPTDEADVQLDFYLDDVYTDALADYPGELRAEYTVRITDRASPGPAGVPPTATVEDVPLGMTVPCAPVTDLPRGATCSAATTMDALVPGSVTEGKRAIWALDRVRVFDGGADGDGDTEGDNTLFATQGVFIP